MNDFACPHCGYHLGSLDVKTSMSSSVNSGRPERSYAHRLTETENLVMLRDVPLVNPNSQDEAKVVQPSLSGPITKATEKKIHQLHRNGLSLARIRHQLKLDAPLSRIASIVNKSH
jgi:hypothetical protein